MGPISTRQSRLYSKLKGLRWCVLVLQLLPRGFLWIAWFWRPRGFEFFSLLRLYNIWETVLGRLRTPGHCIDSRNTFCEGGRFTCPGASAWGAGCRCGTHLEAYIDGRQLCTYPLPLYSLPASPRKDLTQSPGAWIFETATKGTPVQVAWV